MKYLAIPILLLAVTLVGGTEYVYRDGYYYYGSSPQAYTRQLYQSPGYYSCGRYYAGQSYYQYTPYTAPYTAPTVSAADPDWRNKLLDLAIQRDKAEAQIRKGAFEQQYFSEAIRVLGLEGNFNWKNYGQSPPYTPGVGYGYGQNYNQYTTGASGSTVYGYSVNTLQHLYGDANLNQLYQQANRLAENAQGLAGQATTEFGQLIGAEGENRAKVAEIIAKGQAVQEYLRAMQGSSSKTETKTYQFKVTPGANGNGLDVQKVDPPLANVGGGTRKAWEALATAKCMSCHGPGEKKGGFDVTQYPAMSVQQKIQVIQRLVTPDATKRMPRSAEGVAGQLSPEEVQLFLVN